MLPLLASALLRAATPEVLFFITPECPISRKYAPEMERIRKTYGGKGFRFSVVFADPLATTSSAAKWMKEYRVAANPVLDTQQTLAQRFGISVVPTVVVRDASNKVRYFGRIDDRFPALRAERKVPVHTDLRNALEDILANHPVRVPKTEPIGCALPRP